MTTPYQTLALPVDSIQSHPENDFTMDESEMQELVASIRSEGLGQLPLVRKLPDGAYQMIAGHRRLEAYRRLAREDAAFRTIPVTLVDNLDDARARVLLNVTNLVTRRLSRKSAARATRPSAGRCRLCARQTRRSRACARTTSSHAS